MGRVRYTGVPFANVNGIRYHYERTGTGIPIILITGLAGDVCFWKRTVPLLAGYDVIAVDNRGAGKTECGPGFSVTDMADDVVALMGHLGLAKAHILGWSMGSHIALDFAARYPEKAVTLTLVSSYLKRPCRSAYILGIMAKGLNDGTLSYYDAGSFLNVLLKTEGYFAAAEEKGKTVPPAPIGSGRGMAYQLEAVEKYDPGNSAELIEIPTLSVHGTEDIMTDPSCGDGLASKIKGCEIFRAEKEGHAMRPESYIPAFLEFIKKHSP